MVGDLDFLRFRIDFGCLLEPFGDNLFILFQFESRTFTHLSSGSNFEGTLRGRPFHRQFPNLWKYGLYIGEVKNLRLAVFSKTTFVDVAGPKPTNI